MSLFAGRYVIVASLSKIAEDGLVTCALPTPICEYGRDVMCVPMVFVFDVHKSLLSTYLTVLPQIVKKNR